jgi:hypothetical protein
MLAFCGRMNEIMLGTFRFHESVVCSKMLFAHFLKYDSFYGTFHEEGRLFEEEGLTCCFGIY